MKKEFIVSVSGNSFVTYEGLLAEAHEQGLCRISTTLVQIPNADNGNVAIVMAEVETGKGTFCGIGDASAANVGRMIAPHIIRMAECVPIRARILTREGWRQPSEIGIGDDVLAYDVLSDTCVWTPLLDVTMYSARHVDSLVRLSSRSFDATCTPEHTWAIRSGAKRSLRRTCDLRAGDSIIVAAEAESGTSPLTELDGAVLGWLATDGTVLSAMVGRWGPYMRAVIRQSKPHYVEELRELTAAIAHETRAEGRVRDFGAYESDCLPQHTFGLRSDYFSGLMERIGWTEWKWSNLPSLVTHLTSDTRSAMLDAMLKGDGTQVRNGPTWSFGKKRKPGVMAAFEILATLEGRALGSPQTRPEIGLPVRTVRSNRQATAAYLRRETLPAESVWCPTTAFGTWVMNLDGYITITGNTRAKARAMRDAVNIGMTAVEELGDNNDTEPARGSNVREFNDTREPTEQPTRASNYTPTGVHNSRPARQTAESDKPTQQHTGGRPALDSQLKAIRDLSRQAGTPEDPQPGDYNFQLAGARIQELQSATRQGGQQ